MASQLVVRACPPFRVPGRDSGRAAAALEREAGGLLDAGELGRALALVPRAREEFLASRLAQRRFVAELLGVRPGDLTASYSCPRCGAGADVSHGRPGYAVNGAPAPLLLSASRVAGWTLLAAVAEPVPHQRLGVDAEDPRRMDFDGFDTVALTRPERESVKPLSGDVLFRERARLWARKEAVLKMTGEGLRRSPETVDVLHRPQLRDLRPSQTGLPDGLVAAVALG